MKHVLRGLRTLWWQSGGHILSHWAGVQKLWAMASRVVSQPHTLAARFWVKAATDSHHYCRRQDCAWAALLGPVHSSSEILKNVINYVRHITSIAPVAFVALFAQSTSFAARRLSRKLRRPLVVMFTCMFTILFVLSAWFLHLILEAYMLTFHVPLPGG